jgi:7 transmembrane sweet-taste receptor of 3 GCPR
MQLWRIDRVMQAAKRKVTYYLQALWTCALILVVTLLLLILWTALDPWKWEREYVNMVPPETLGQCTSDNFAGFVWSLTAILMFCTLSILVMAWKTQTIAQNLSDASTVFYLILTQVQAWFVGIPILAVIGDDSVDTVYFGRILLIWMFAMAPLFIVLLPRVSLAIRQRLNPELKKNRGVVHVSGITPSQTASQFPTNRNFESTSSDPSRRETYISNQPSRPFQSSTTAPLDPNVASSLKMADVDDDEEIPKPARRGALPTIVSQQVLQVTRSGLHERECSRESLPSFAGESEHQSPEDEALEEHRPESTGE